MREMIEILDKTKCCGCTACQAVCEANCISMFPDCEGFLYPQVESEKCTHCEKCVHACPVLRPKTEIPSLQKGYVLNHKDDLIRSESTSGGAFTPIASYVIERGGVVFGAVFDPEFNVIHRYHDTIENLKAFRGSKYVQSDMNNCYKEAKTFLENGRWVCFSGTPCQIEGLLHYLGKDYDNLITVDLVCRSVPSPLVWKRYLTYIKARLGVDKITSIAFRSKNKYGYQYPNLHISTPTRDYYCGIETDPYMRSFFENIAVRPICYTCPFRKKFRKSDFTIWDCFFPEQADPALNDNKGSTCMIIHSSKGINLFAEIIDNFRYAEVDPENLHIREMFSDIPINAKRDKFFEDIKVMDEKEHFDKYFRQTLKVRLSRLTKIVLARTNLYKAVKQYVKKN